MIKISMREFSHHISEYIDKAQKGEQIVLTKRNKPLVDILPHRETANASGWKRKINKIRVKGESFAQTITKLRGEEKL